jgi:hypothetical protein
MTSIFLHGRGSWASIGQSERRAVIDKRGELASLHEHRIASIRRSLTGRNRRQVPDAIQGPQGDRHRTDTFCPRGLGRPGRHAGPGPPRSSLTPTAPVVGRRWPIGSIAAAHDDRVRRHPSRHSTPPGWRHRARSGRAKKATRGKLGDEALPNRGAGYRRCRGTLRFSQVGHQQGAARLALGIQDQTQSD